VTLFGKLYLFNLLAIYSRGGTRTPDPVINSHLLYHLSYSGSAHKNIGHEGLDAIETGAYSLALPEARKGRYGLSLFPFVSFP
jgi:hypothetical protein